jgi:GNAT superfamily N-acetyltransferase
MMIRPMLSTDAASVEILSGQLGYPAKTEEIQARFTALSADPEAALMVAESDGGAILGWMHVQGRRFIESAPYAEVLALVVDAALRRSGVGRELLAAAEGWAISRGYDLVQIRSNTAREGARPFYLGRGYEIWKTQYVFKKRLR